MSLMSGNLVPTMTSTTAPSGTVIGLSGGAGNEGWRAFDKILNAPTYLWVPSATVPKGWVGYTFPTNQRIVIYAVTGAFAVDKSPKNWTFEGSNDATNWTVLDTQTNISFASNERKQFTTSNRTAYKSYRLNITVNNGNATQVSIQELELYDITFNDKFLISLGDGEVYSGRFSNPDINLIPTMTSNTAPSGVASTSSLDTTNDAWCAFDKSTSTHWISASGSKTNQWLSYQFTTPKIIAKYTLSNNHNITAAPKDWTFEGSNDGGATWTVLDTQSNVIGWVLNEKRVFTFNNQSSFLLYRIFMKTNNGQANLLSMTDFEMMETINNLILLGNKTPSESDFLNRGLDKSIAISLNDSITKRTLVESASVALGSGKVFKKSIDTSKIAIKKVSIT